MVWAAICLAAYSAALVIGLRAVIARMEGDRRLSSRLHVLMWVLALPSAVGIVLLGGGR